MAIKIPSLETIQSLYQLRERPAGDRWTLEESYAFCRALTVSHYENFPVGSRLLPKAKRPHVYAIYAFARVADDFSDEPQYEGLRLDYLNGWDSLLEECYQGRADHPIFLALADSVRKLDLPIELFRDLLHAFKQDVTVNRYESLESVVNHYCRFSANPVGRLILHLFDYRDKERMLLSDHICTALQLTNFWQDVAIDLQKDRVYLPRNLMRADNYTVEDLFARVYDERFQRIMRTLTAETWDLFDRGYPLVEQVRWPLNAELRFTWLGGVTILSRMAQNRYNVFDHRPALNKWDYVKSGGRSLLGIGWMRRRFRRMFEPLRTAA
ncbi:MAG: squalene synthase HpnC [bacterium]